MSNFFLGGRDLLDIYSRAFVCLFVCFLKVLLVYYFNSKEINDFGFSPTGDYQTRQTSRDGLGQTVFSSGNLMFRT